MGRTWPGPGERTGRHPDPDALELLAGHKTVADEIIRVYQILSLARERIEHYRMQLGVQQAIEATPPSAAHPSTAAGSRRTPPTIAGKGRGVQATRRRPVPSSLTGGVNGAA
ncbi:hypothetical protein GCM10009545_12780 [Saccharopolyspora thermophila]|uniref:Uncharacterized protein n=1 Tax=Saccharopolyspora thermophila TaxID=89367 RepID=A0ABN1C6M7_9PSEU